MVHWSKDLEKRDEVRKKIKDSVSKVDKQKWKAKISKACRGRKAWNKGLPKEQQPRYGKPVSRKQVENMRKIGKLPTNPWNKDLNEWSPRIRKESIRKFVLDRDDNKCLECDSTERLVVHHIKHYEQLKDKENIHSFDNLMTLCRGCHIKLHNQQKKVMSESDKNV